MNREIKAFIFDLDGVITNTAEYHFLAWKQLAEELNINFTKGDNERLKGVSRIRSFEIILEINNILDRFSKQERKVLADKKNSYYVELIKQITPKDVLPGIRELLDDLKMNNVRTAIASASKNAFTVIEGLEMKNEFNYIVDAKKIKNSKPAPDVFLKAAEALCVEPKCCVGVEDAEAGIEAINAAGMFSVGVGSPEKMKEANFIVNSTIELNYEEIKEVFLL